jgi:hypothetical protein
VFTGNAEYVFELLVPPRDFTHADTKVFEPLLRSLKLTGHVVIQKPKTK